MTEDLEVVQAAMKRLTEARAKDAKDAETSQRALAVALNGVQAALTELLALTERTAAAEPPDLAPMVERIVGAIRGLKVQPQTTVEAPSVNVSPKLDVTVTAGESHNHVTVPAPEVKVIPATWKTVEVKFKYDAGAIVGATLTRVDA